MRPSGSALRRQDHLSSVFALRLLPAERPPSLRWKRPRRETESTPIRTRPLSGGIASNNGAVRRFVVPVVIAPLITFLIAACSPASSSDPASVSDPLQPGVTVTQTVQPPTAAAVITVTESAATAAATDSSGASAAAGPVGLEVPDRPWTLTVIGDSTGTGAAGWVHYLGKRLVEAYQRPVTIYDWDLDCACYDQTSATDYPTEPGSTAAARIVIWNGSASGKTGAYALEYFDEMVPEDPDLVIINHGHNNGTSREAVDEIDQLASTLTNLFGADLPIFITEQNPRFDFGAEKAQTTAKLLESEFGGGPYALIDIFDEFGATGDLESVLTEDGLHPSEPGNVLWAAVVARAIGLPVA